jgi:hypothetical protein
MLSRSGCRGKTPKTVKHFTGNARGSDVAIGLVAVRKGRR